MNVSIYSRNDMQALIDTGFPKDSAVISFYSPQEMKARDYLPVDYKSKPERLIYICVPDIDIEALSSYGLTFETYMCDADELAEFIASAISDGLSIICQCDYGQSRSAACAAAIVEFYEHNGISIFADYRYYPNQLVFNKVYEALKQLERTRI